MTDSVSENIVIRTLEPDELTAWLDFLCRDVFPNDPRETVEGIWYDDPGKDFGGVFVAAEPDGSIVGSVRAECRMLGVAGQAVYGGIVSGAGVKAAYRGRGIARRLFDACHRRLYDQGAAVSHLYSKPDTLEFYLHLGYRSLPRVGGESFYRMVRLIRPFSIGDTPVSDSDALAAVLTAVRTGRRTGISS